MKSGVYIIEDKERGMYKIGCSKDTYKRSKDVIKACRFSGIKTDLQVFCIINCMSNLTYFCIYSYLLKTFLCVYL